MDRSSPQSSQSSQSSQRKKKPPRFSSASANSNRGTKFREGSNDIESANYNDDPSLASVADSPDLLARALLTLKGSPEAALELLQGAVNFIKSSSSLVPKSILLPSSGDTMTEISAFGEEEDLSREQLQIIKARTMYNSE